MIRLTLALPLITATAIAFAGPALAKDSLGMFGQWGAFRDPGAGRCYAIAMAGKSRAAREFQPYASVGTWPRRGIRGQVHFRLSRQTAADPGLSLSLGGRRIALVGGGENAWAPDRAGDAAVVAAMRGSGSMTVSGRDARGNRFSDSYSLDGAATALDAATVGCSQAAR
jgi:hypothetical protein